MEIIKIRQKNNKWIIKKSILAQDYSLTSLRCVGQLLCTKLITKLITKRARNTIQPWVVIEQHLSGRFTVMSPILDKNTGMVTFPTHWLLVTSWLNWNIVLNITEMWHFAQIRHLFQQNVMFWTLKKKKEFSVFKESMWTWRWVSWFEWLLYVKLFWIM